ncbi:MAG TPA: DnaD domain protein [Tissierellaceae bacterium]|nr:DnaD domain protein [Tissierellaceae bacterium]
MSFFLETTDMDLGDTPIENIFINDYMPMANGTYVKVYLIGYKYAYDRDYKIDLNNETIAKHLNIPLEDVLRAWDFWQSKGIIEKIVIDKDSSVNYKVKFLNLKQLYIKNNIKLFSTDKYKVVKNKNTTEDLIKANKIPEINNMFNKIDDIMGRQTVPMEKQKILSWITDYNMNPDVIEKAFSYGVERKGVRNLNYVEGIVRNWYDEGLTNMEAVMEYFRQRDEKYYLYQKIMKALGLDKRPIRDDEIDLIDKWFEEYKFDLDLVLKACEADKNPIPSIKYVNGILKSWYNKGIKTIDDIEILDKPAEKVERAKKTQVRRSKAATRFHNFEQRSDQYSSDDLEKMAQKKRESYSQRSKGES